MPLENEQRQTLIEWQEISRRQFDKYFNAWQNGQIGLAEFELLFKQELKDLYIATAWTATGGPDETDFADYGRVGRRLRDQYQFMHNFFQEIARGELSAAQIKNRMGMYTNGANVILEQVGNSEFPRLPHYPRDSSTRCRSNCKCTHDWVEVENGWDVFWRVHPAEHCPDCLRRKDKAVRIRFNVIQNPDVWD